MIDFALELARQAGATLMDGFGQAIECSSKGDLSNIVTAADLRSERLLVQAIRGRYPGHSLIAEESGYDLRASDFTWVIDPLDGSSNYAAGIPWFGVLIGVLKGTTPVAAVLHLPALGDTYTAEAGAGTCRNGVRVQVTPETALGQVLWAFGMDGGGAAAERHHQLALLAELLPRVRNLRTTNSLVDPAYTADGRLGGLLNLSTRLWDIVAPMLIVQEAGGLYTGVDGHPITLDLGASAAERHYAVLAGAPPLHHAARAALGPGAASL